MAKPNNQVKAPLEVDKTFPVGPTHTMRLRRDGAVTIPVELRDKFRLLKGTTLLELQALTNGDIIIRRASNECNCCKKVMEQPTDVSRGLGVCKKCENEVLNMVRMNSVASTIEKTINVKPKPANMFVLDYYILCLREYYEAKAQAKTGRKLQRTRK